jgi:hypothetical protein
MQKRQPCQHTWNPCSGASPCFWKDGWDAVGGERGTPNTWEMLLLETLNADDSPAFSQAAESAVVRTGLHNAREESSRKLDTAEDEEEALTGGTRPHQEVRLVRDAAPRLKKKLL